MKKSFIFLLAIFVCALGSAAAPAQSESNSQTPNAVSAPSSPAATEPSEASVATALPSTDISSRISEARRLLSSRQTAGTSRDLVTVAAFDTATSQISIFSLPKNEFLVKDADLSANTQAGGTVRVHVVRANGVNTAVTVTDVSTGRQLVPLLVQFPIVKGGAVSGIAGAVLKNGIPVAIGGTTSNPTFAPNLRGVAAGVGASAGQQLLNGKGNSKQKGNQSNPLGNALGGFLNRH